MNKPKVKIQPTTADWILEVTALIGLLLIILIVILSYKNLPDVIPRHYTGNGQPDGYGRKSLLFVSPAIAIVIYIILTLAVKYPNMLNYPVRITRENASKQYTNLMMMVRIVKTLIVAMLLYVTFVTIQIGLGRMHGLGNWFLPVVVFSLLGTIGLFIHRGFRLR